MPSPRIRSTSPRFHGKQYVAVFDRSRRNCRSLDRHARELPATREHERRVCCALSQGGEAVVKTTFCSRNLPRVPVRERDGAGCQNRHRQRAKGIGRSEIHHVFGIGEGCGIPAVRRQRRRHELPGNARSDAADQQLRPRDRPDGARRRATRERRTIRPAAAQRRRCPERSSSRSRRNRRMSRSPGPTRWSSTSRPGAS